ncbi:Gp138 family membrane-puncturing spike protein [Tropicimonas sp. IMCC34011]|uniref:Gp138 family membrane-puncturing spike protein n=1 Tax=Tropicimonas sp. IMCC34011 TaxID=2248759 RepID=UPI0013006D8E|nr:Gp138 family membrane-puncturing spike protein [Tropicimonas sp. IMCC34011]
MGYLGRYTNTFRDSVGAYAQGEREDQWGPFPAEVTAWHPERGTVDVRPLISKRRYDGTRLPIPDLMDVPVDMPRGAAGAMTFPITAGDRVTLTPAMRSTESFDTDDEIDDPRSFNLSDVRASISGGDPLTEPLANVDTKNLHLRFGPTGDYGIRGSADGKIAIEGAQGNVYTLIAAALRSLANAQTIVGSGSSSGAWSHDQKATVLGIADLLDGMAL